MINNIQKWCETDTQYKEAKNLQAQYDLAREVNPDTPHVIVIDCRSVNNI